MFKHLRPVWAEINLDNLEYNMKEIKEKTKSKDIMAVVKADAYGHGALDIAETLLRNGVTSFAVAVVNEAVELRRNGIDVPIMILGFTPPNLCDLLLKYDIEQTVYSYEFAEELSKMAVSSNKIAHIHIAIDTGMGRIGFLPKDESIEQIVKISRLKGINIKGVFSHFSTADEKDKEYTYKQLAKFNEFCDKLKKRSIDINIRHIANSAAIMDIPQCHFEAIRPGIILYGYYPSEEVNKSVLDLKPVMSLKTNIVHIKSLGKGEYISYGRKFRTNRDSIIATLPVGYADGYTRMLFNKAKVIINDNFAPVVGNICMDQCMVDVTDLGNVKIGDEVLLMGKSDNLSYTADDIAKELGTINYEIICMISKRVPRVYISNGQVVKIRNYV